MSNPELFKIINENYESFEKYAVRNKFLVNSRAVSQEDMFHNCLLSAIRDKNFKYIDDETTLHYLRKILKQIKLNEITLSKITMIKGMEIGVLIKGITNTQDEFEFELEILNTLTDKQRKIYDLLIEGWSKTDIAEKLNVHITTIIGHIKLIRKKLTR